MYINNNLLATIFFHFLPGHPISWAEMAGSAGFRTAAVPHGFALQESQGTCRPPYVI